MHTGSVPCSGRAVVGEVKGHPSDPEPVRWYWSTAPFIPHSQWVSSCTRFPCARVELTAVRAGSLTPRGCMLSAPPLGRRPTRHDLAHGGLAQAARFPSQVHLPPFTHGRWWQSVIPVSACAPLIEGVLPRRGRGGVEQREVMMRPMAQRLCTWGTRWGRMSRCVGRGQHLCLWLSPPLGVSQAIVSPSFVSAERPQGLPEPGHNSQGRGA